MSVEVYEDPVQEIFDKAVILGKRIALNLMDEVVIILPRDMSSQPNEIMALGIVYEKLESEVPNNSLRAVA